MPKPARSQKQIAERYKGNLGYYNRLHPWRRSRMIISLATIVAGIIAICVFQQRGRETFFNAGKISSSHARFADDCAKCHDKSLLDRRALTGAKFTKVLRERFASGVAFDPIDRKCETCHVKHSFHEANVVQNKSCSACHQEHQGSNALRLVASSQCASCHDNPGLMQAAAEKGEKLPPIAFHRHPHPPQQVTFELPRPPRGYTRVFSSFWNGHPEFQLVAARQPNPDVLRFNHQRHFGPDVPPVNGQKLDCNYCHKPNPDGRFYQRISFALHCQACHSLQFDIKNPELKIPHGDVALARAFLRTLPAQYADYARLTKRVAGENETRTFVTQQIRQLRDQFRTGEELERAVFFTADPYKPQAQMMSAVQRANFTGCAFCHDIKPAANTAAVVTKPLLVDRWMPQSDFNHVKHTSVQCEECHHASQSRETADVLMPSKAGCVVCHSPQGKVVAECITCHTYHAPAAAQTIVAKGPGSMKQMLLGRK